LRRYLPVILKIQALLVAAVVLRSLVDRAGEGGELSQFEAGEALLGYDLKQ
jgi:hypothetical protein